MTREMADKHKRRTAVPFSHTSAVPARVPVFIDLEQYFPEPTPNSESFLIEQTAPSPDCEGEISQRLNKTSQQSSIPVIPTVSDPSGNDPVVTLTREQRTISVSSGESFYTKEEQNVGRKSAKRRHHSDANPGLVDGAHVNYKRAKMNYSNQTLVPSRSQQFKSYETTSPVFTLETLTMEIKQECSKSVQSTETLQKKLKLKSFLENLLSSFLPGCSLHLCGSSSSGFGNESSDADFCLILNHLRQTSNRREAMMVLRQMYKVLLSDRYSFLGELQVIPASVPILKFKDMISGCQCDINVNNVVGVRNTYLLRGYCRVDYRVKPLVMLVKKWAKKHDINDASQGTLSSYALTLMVIHYLQAVCKPAVVPVLQLKYPAVFQQHGDVQNLLSQDPCNRIVCNKSENRQTLGELLLGFFKYYAEDFRWSEEYFNIKKGVTLPRNPNHYKRKHIVIEEPFDGNNVAKSVCSLEEFSRIKLKFRLAWHTLRISPSLESIKVI